MCISVSPRHDVRIWMRTFQMGHINFNIDFIMSCDLSSYNSDTNHLPVLDCNAEIEFVMQKYSPKLLIVKWYYKLCKIISGSIYKKQYILFTFMFMLDTHYHLWIFKDSFTHLHMPCVHFTPVLTLFLSLATGLHAAISFVVSGAFSYNHKWLINK